MAWRLVSSDPPKFGEMVLVYDAKIDPVERYYVAYLQNELSRKWYVIGYLGACSSETPNIHPSHWMPLPPKPK